MSSNFKFSSVAEPLDVLIMSYGQFEGDNKKKYCIYKVRMYQKGLTPLDFADFVRETARTKSMLDGVRRYELHDLYNMKHLGQNQSPIPVHSTAIRRM